MSIFLYAVIEERKIMLHLSRFRELFIITVLLLRSRDTHTAK